MTRRVPGADTMEHDASSNPQSDRLMRNDDLATRRRRAEATLRQARPLRKDNELRTSVPPANLGIGFKIKYKLLTDCKTLHQCDHRCQFISIVFIYNLSNNN
ncbi:hypothetical protein QTP88_012891 [Uroleucon formosanum]